MAVAMASIDRSGFRGAGVHSRRKHALRSRAPRPAVSRLTSTSGKKDVVLQDLSDALLPASICTSAAADYSTDLVKTWPHISGDCAETSTHDAVYAHGPAIASAVPHDFFNLSFPETNFSNLVSSGGFEDVANGSAPYSILDGNGIQYTQQETSRINDGDDESEQGNTGRGGDEGGRWPTETRRLSATNDQCFGCPFFKYDPVRHWRCYRKYQLRRLGDVKLHIERVHLMSIHHCRNCWEEFTDVQQLENHCSQPQFSCPLVQGPERLLPEEFDALKQVLAHARHGLSESEKWYMMFCHIFPSILPPASPYVRLSFDEPLEIMRQHASDQGLYGHLSAVLGEHGIVLDGVDRPDILQADLIDAVLPISVAAIMPPYQRDVLRARRPDGFA